MVNRIDIPGSGGRASPLRQLPAHGYTPVLGTVDAGRILQIFSALPPLNYPINSAGELREKLGGKDATLTIAGRTFQPAQLVSRLEAHYFPIASFENFAEKIAAAIRSKDPTAATTTTLKSTVKVSMAKRTNEVDGLRAALSNLRFPLRNADELVRQLEGGGSYRFRGREIHPHSVKAMLPARLFPIQSLDVFVAAIEKLVRAQPQAALPAKVAHAHAHAPLAGHAPALATRVGFGAQRAHAPSLHTLVAREPGLAAEIAHEGVQSNPGAKAVRVEPRHR